MLVWMDLEMTGLDPSRHVIVEIATLVTDDNLEMVGEGLDLVVHQPPAALAEMEDIVRNMHTSSGLIKEIEASTISLEDEYLHYRSIDVSSGKELAKRWFPKECAGAPQKNSAHRALGDIEESVAELRYYREAIFKRAD